MLQSWLPKQLEANHDLLTLEEHREAFEEEFGGGGLHLYRWEGHRSPVPDGGWPIKKSRR